MNLKPHPLYLDPPVIPVTLFFHSLNLTVSHLAMLLFLCLSIPLQHLAVATTRVSLGVQKLYSLSLLQILFSISLSLSFSFSLYRSLSLPLFLTIFPLHFFKLELAVVTYFFNFHYWFIPFIFTLLSRLLHFHPYPGCLFFFCLVPLRTWYSVGWACKDCKVPRYLHKSGT